MTTLAPTSLAIRLVEAGLVPDPLTRAGIRRLLRERLHDIAADDPAAAAQAAADFVSAMQQAPLALLTDKANEQHYEVPAEFFAQVMRPHRKYSSCWWPDGIDTLPAAEAAALNETCLHADLHDGQAVLELGCGWGSLSLWMAEHYPNSRIVAVSNSHSQRAYIEAQAGKLGLRNLQVITCDMNDFNIDQRFDRVVSVEMFEHMRNWPELFQRIHRWLRADGKFFMHIFVHRTTPYPFEDQDDSDWMSRYFFSGGMMPSDDLPLQFQEHLRFARRWRWHGSHYARTLNAWLANMDANRDQVWPILEATYGKADAKIWWMRWRVFFMACAELFDYNNGNEWWVSHYLFERRP
jgi:cyclopropane-fatty-acyl-phospholipid synthase